MKTKKCKKNTIENLRDFWFQINLKDQIKNFGNFMGSVHYLAAVFEVIFEEKEATNLKQVANGMSYITEDFTIARAILDEGFPKGFNEASFADPNADYEL